MLGDASVASGDFYEALNTACLMAARVTFVVVRQALDEGAPVGTQTATSAVALAKAFSLPTHEASAEADAVANALRDARVAEGPSLVQVHLTR